MEWAFETLRQLGEFQFPVALLISFLAGVVTSFNPCMLGMASSVMAFQDDSKKKSHLPIPHSTLGSNKI
jgi:cytochrome c-type biogenesis protein